MSNPWEDIDLNSYENHMSLGSVFQLQTMNKMMKDQFYAYPVQSIMILGVAGGNGLEHIDKRVFNKVYGVDINRNYLAACINRYPELHGVFEAVHTDLTQEIDEVPYADLIVANLFIEYIGYECFKNVVRRISPQYVSCIIQINVDAAFVSDSPYLHVFDRLDEIHHQMEETALMNTMAQIGYRKIVQMDEDLPNKKKLVRIDFTGEKSNGQKNCG